MFAADVGHIVPGRLVATFLEDERVGSSCAVHAGIVGDRPLVLAVGEHSRVLRVKESVFQVVEASRQINADRV